MPRYTDIYVLSRRRTHREIEAFFGAFVPRREEAADEYEVPQYAVEPRYRCSRAEDLAVYCCDNPREQHAIYWRALEGAKPEHAMVFFLADGHVIYGVFTDAADEAFVRMEMERLKQYFGSDEVLVYWVSGSPESAEVFRAEVSRRGT